jgi:hypothetical protein
VAEAQIRLAIAIDNAHRHFANTDDGKSKTRASGLKKDEEAASIRWPLPLPFQLLQG